MLKNKTWASWILQIIPVMLGVYLGLLANNWNEKRKVEKEKSEILILLQNELTQNKEQVKSKLEYHLSIMDSLTVIRDNEFENPVSSDRISSFWRGMQGPKTQSSVHQSAIIKGLLTEFSLEEINAINNVYLLQKELSTYLDNAVSSFLHSENNDMTDIRPLIQKVSMILNDLHYAENELLVSYDKLISILKVE